jgi:hypothetical protein
VRVDFAKINCYWLEETKSKLNDLGGDYEMFSWFQPTIVSHKVHLPPAYASAAPLHSYHSFFTFFQHVRDSQRI